MRAMVVYHGYKVPDAAAKISLTDVNHTLSKVPAALSTVKHLTSLVCHSTWNSTLGDALRNTCMKVPDAAAEISLTDVNIPFPKFLRRSRRPNASCDWFVTPAGTVRLVCPPQCLYGSVPQ